MRKHLLLIVFLFTYPILLVNAQDATTSEAKSKRTQPDYIKHKLPEISIGIGKLSLFGDISDNTTLYKYTNYRMAYNLRIEHRLFSFMGLAINGLYGKLAENERSVNAYRNLTFETTVMQGEFNVVFYFDNNLFINRASRFAPFVYGGVGYMKFDPKADMKNADGSTYNYWEDGTIRDQPMNELTIGTANKIRRDYKYETSLDVSYIDSLPYKKQTITFPIGAGLKFKLSDIFDVNVMATYYLTQSDFIDNFKKGSQTDNFLYTSVAFSYHIGTKAPKKEPTEFDDVDFYSLELEDDDQDGVKNVLDICPGTPDGVSVNSSGCPPDQDNDGIPDYQDKEPNTSSGAMVDENGETLTDISIEEKSADTIAADHNTLKSAFPSHKFTPVKQYFPNPNMEQETPASKVSGQLGEFQSYDLNNDGIISVDEIGAAIDAFFEGDTSTDVNKLSRLIDFFFEQ